jgi:RHS repeat-associated protein
VLAIRGGAQTTKSSSSFQIPDFGSGPIDPAKLWDSLPAVPGVKKPVWPKDGVAGDRVDRPSQASEKVPEFDRNAPAVVEHLRKAGSVKGPNVSSGPGEVAAIPASVLPAGAASAMDLVSGLSGELAGDTKAAAKGKDGRTKEAVGDSVNASRATITLDAKDGGGPGELEVPALPDDSKLDVKVRGKRKRFDEKTSKLSERTGTGSKFTNADGSVTAAIGKSGTADDPSGKGKGVDEDATLKSDGKGRVARATGVIRASLPESLTDDAEVLSVGTVGARIGLGVRKADAAKGKGAPAKVGENPGDIGYDGVFGAGSSLDYSVTNGGVKEEIVLAAVPTAGEVAYRFPLTLDGFTVRRNESGSISFLDGSGKEAYVVPLALAWEKPVVGAKPAVFGKVAVSVEKNAVGGQELVVRPDESWLRDPARKYPVVIDPTITPGQGSSTNGYGYVDSAYPTTHLTNSCVSAGTACIGTYSASRVAYTYLRYDTSVLVNQAISSAYLRINIPRCTSFPNTLSIRPLASPFDASTVSWSSRPNVQNQVANMSVNGPGVVTVDMTLWAQQYASGTWPSVGFQVSSTAADCDVQVIGTNSSYLEATYAAPSAATNHLPVVTIQTPALGSTISSPATMSVFAADADGDPLLYWFVANGVNPTGYLSTPGWIDSNSFGLNGSAGQAWSWSAYVYDGYGVTSTSGSFTIGAAQPIPGYSEGWSWGTSGDYATISSDNQPNAGVNTGTKRFVYTATDAQVAAAGPALSITRTYNSADTSVGVFGQGWSSLLDTRVDVDSAQNLLFRLPDGRRELHPFANGMYRTEPGYWSTAAADPNGGWTLLEKDGSLWRFATTGKLVSVTDRNGRSLVLITDAATGKVTSIRAVGYQTYRALTITWNGNLVASVQDALNPAWNYVYSGNLLTKVCDPRNNNTANGLCITHAYDASSRMFEVFKPGGNRDIKVSYYLDGTVYQRFDGMNNTWTYSYNSASRISTTTKPNGATITEQYNEMNQMALRTESGDANAPALTTTFGYDPASSFVVFKTTPKGQWFFLNDYRGNHIRVSDPSGATSYSKFDNRDLLIEYKDANSNIWKYGYDANGNKVRETNPYGWSRTWAYQATSNTALSGTLTSETDWNGNTTTYTYNPMGDVESITYPGVSGDNVVYTYDALGRKESEKGRIPAPGITYTYDALNAPLTITEPPVTNPLTNVVHRKRIALTYKPNHLKESESVNDIGGSGAPDIPRTSTYTYDLNDRELTITDPMGYVSSKQYDANGNLTYVTDGKGTTTFTAFSARDFPASVSVTNYADPAGLNSSGAKTLSTMFYDADGRMVTQTDGRGLNHVFTYDGMDRLLTKNTPVFTDRNGVARSVLEVKNVYDLLGNKTQESRGTSYPNLRLTVYVYDLAGRPFFQATMGRAWQFFEFDRNGNTTKTDRMMFPPAIQTVVTFDPRNRPLTQKVMMSGAGADRLTTNTYTKFGTLATVTDPLNAMSTYQYDDLGRVSSVTAPSAAHEDTGGSPVTSWAAQVKGYDTFGNVTHERDAKGNIVTSTYDKNNRRTRVDQPVCTTGCQTGSGVFETWGYDGAGNTTSYRDRRSYVTDYQFDSLNRNTKTLLQALGAAARTTRTAQYDFAGNIVQTTNEVGAVVSTVYNELGLPKSKTDAYGTSVMDYNDLGQLVWQKDPSTFTSTFEYLPTGELTKKTDQVGAVTTFWYDAVGRQVARVDPAGRFSMVEYNAASEVIAKKRLIAGAVYSTETASYDSAGNLKQTVNPVGVTMNYTYDALRRLTAVTYPLGGGGNSTTYGYDRNSNLTRSTNGRGYATTYSYNEWNLQTATIEPATAAHPNLGDRTFAMTYDTAGLVIGEAKPGTSAVKAYDELGHPKSETWTGAGAATVTKNFGYDAGGRLRSTDGMTFDYNYRNQLTQVVSSVPGSVGTSAFGYDPNGNMTSRNQTVANGTTASYTLMYTPRNEPMVTIQYDPTPGSLLFAVSQRMYGLDGQPMLTSTMAGANVGGQVSMTSQLDLYTYDGVGRLQNSSTMSMVAPVSSTYGYFADDNVQSKTVAIPGNASSGVHQYTYDWADRLKTWTGPQGAVTYDYDGAGNRTKAGAGAFTYDERNRITSGPGASYVWAARGTPVNQTVNGVTTAFSADAADRVIGAGSVSYVFDSLDRVTTRSESGATTSFKYTGVDMDASSTLGSNGVFNNYSRTATGEVYVQQTGTIGGTLSLYAIGYDAHGDAITWAGIDGLHASKQYDPFGAVTNATTSTAMASFGTAGKLLGFQGDYTDPTSGDVNMGARWYNPTTATFRSRDTYSGQLSTPFSLNRYTYGLNNPLRYWDPTGREADYAGMAMAFYSSFLTLMAEATSGQNPSTDAAIRLIDAGIPVPVAVNLDLVMSQEHFTKSELTEEVVYGARLEAIGQISDKDLKSLFLSPVRDSYKDLRFLKLGLAEKFSDDPRYALTYLASFNSKVNVIGKAANQFLKQIVDIAFVRYQDDFMAAASEVGMMLITSDLAAAPNTRSTTTPKPHPTGADVDIAPKVAPATKPGGVHVDIGGEGKYPGAINVNRNPSAGPGEPNFPNLVQGNSGNLPIRSGSANLVTIENTPIRNPGELGRIVKPGGMIEITGPADYVNGQIRAVVAGANGRVISTTPLPGGSVRVVIRAGS